MSVERNKDGSITIRDKNSMTVVGLIHTQTSVQKNYEQWVEDCAQLVKACPHSVQETEQYFLEQCDALPIPPGDRRLEVFKSNVIMNFYQDRLLHLASRISAEMSDEEIEKWKTEQDAVRKEVDESPPERFGLILKGYVLPRTERNAPIYEQARKRMEESFLRRAKDLGQSIPSPSKVDLSEICFFFEETTGQGMATGGGEELSQQLIIFQGVTEEDIEKRSPRFHAYLYAMRELGKLPGTPELQIQT